MSGRPAMGEPDHADTTNSTKHLCIPGEPATGVVNSCAFCGSETLKASCDGSQRCMCGLNETLARCLMSPPLTVNIRVHRSISREDACAELTRLAEADAVVSREVPFRVSPHPMLEDAITVTPTPQSTQPSVLHKEVIVSRKCGESVLLGNGTPHAARRTPHAARRTPHAARRTPHADIHAPGVVTASPKLSPGDMVSVLVDIDDRFLHHAPVRLLEQKQCSAAWLKGKWQNELNKVLQRLIGFDAGPPARPPARPPAVRQPHQCVCVRSRCCR